MVHNENKKIVLVAERYLQECIDENTVIVPYAENETIPIALRNMYQFYEMTILSTTCILLLVDNEKLKLEYIQKHIKWVERITLKKAVLYYREISNYLRKQLTNNRIPFVIENGQMFLPFLGLHFSRLSHTVEKAKVFFNASTQLVYLHYLYHENENIGTNELAKKLNISAMSASRALNELYRIGLVKFQIAGKTNRSKKYKRIPDPEYFTLGKDFLLSPIEKTVYLKKCLIFTLLSGTEALAEQTMLNPPNHQIRAIGKIEFKTIPDTFIADYEEAMVENLTQLEIWKYNPKLLTNSDCVDKASLYASLRDEKDERVQIALEELLKGEKWYME